jgi:hypothetical protein
MAIDDGRQIGAGGRLGIAKVGVAPEAHGAFFIQGEILDIIRMIAGRTVAVLALHPLVRRTTVRPRIVFVAFKAGIGTLVLYREVLPFLDVSQAMVVIGKALAVYAKVFRHQKKPGEKNKSNYPNCDP